MSGSKPPPGFASPPCMLHEVDPAYLGYLNDDETIAFLNELLEAERAGAAGVGEMAAPADAAHRALLQAVATDEARFCAMLTRHILRLKGRPTAATGRFLDKLRETLPKIDDPMLYNDLRQMLEAHDANIAACEKALTP